MPSFDVVSRVNEQEVVNAIDQVKREIDTRYDFKGSKSSIQLEQLEIKVLTDDNMKLKALQEIIKQKLAKRGVSLKSVTFEEPEKAGGDMLRQLIKIKNGLKEDELKRINKLIKEMKVKVSSQIQGDELRVSGKKRDDLQTVIAQLKSGVTDLELQFVNFRE